MVQPDRQLRAARIEADGGFHRNETLFGLAEVRQGDTPHVVSTCQVRRRRESPFGLHKGSLKVAPPEQRKSPTCASFRVRGIEIECTADQALGRDLNLHEAALLELRGGNQLSPRKPAVGSRKIRREIDRKRHKPAPSRGRGPARGRCRGSRW